MSSPVAIIAKEVSTRVLGYADKSSEKWSTEIARAVIAALEKAGYHPRSGAPNAAQPKKTRSTNNNRLKPMI